MADYLRLRGPIPGPLFVGMSGKSLDHGRRFSLSGIHQVFKERVTAVGLGHLTMHDTRRGYVSSALEAGIDPVAIARQVGHQAVQTTMRYDRRPLAQLQDLAQRMPNPFEARGCAVKRAERKALAGYLTAIADALMSETTRDQRNYLTGYASAHLAAWRGCCPSLTGATWRAASPRTGRRSSPTSPSWSTGCVVTDMEMAAQLVECTDQDVTALRTLYRDLNTRYEAQGEDDGPEGEQAAHLLDQAGRLASRLASLG